MECCHFVSVCHGSLSLHHTKGAPISTSVLSSKKPMRLIVRATTTLPETPGMQFHPVWHELPCHLINPRICKNDRPFIRSFSVILCNTENRNILSRKIQTSLLASCAKWVAVSNDCCGEVGGLSELSRITVDLQCDPS